MSLPQDELARIAAALERLAPPAAAAPDWLEHPAYVWQGFSARAVTQLEAPALGLLRGIDAQKALVAENVSRLAHGHAAHDMLLWGARGMGKSALLRSAVAASQAVQPRQIALVQVAPDALSSLAALFGALGKIERRFLVYIDDLGFEDSDSSGPRALRSWLEGGVEARPNNVRLCVTSNRRNIVERENGVDPDTGGRDAVDDSLALADRFGLKLGFQYPDQDAYLKMVGSYAAHFDLDWDEADALSFAQSRGGRSGRIAWHYTIELAGRAGRRI